MSCLANFCKAALCIQGSLVINALAQDVTAQLEPAETTKSPALLLGGIDHKFEGYGYALREVIPINELPSRIHYKQGEVSLIVDQEDRQTWPSEAGMNPYLVVYLVNDTDQKVSGVIGEQPKVKSQIRRGGGWFSRELQAVAECGTISPPTDLLPRHALALGGESDRTGDMDGDIRYVFLNFESEPLRGRYFSNRLDQVISSETSSEWLSFCIDTGLIKGEWNKQSIATNPEEFCAALELDRYLLLEVKGRAKLLKWMVEDFDPAKASPEQSQAVAQLRKTLSRPWLVIHDGQMLADRCIAALSGKPGLEYGTPEKCRACVWRFLAWTRVAGGVSYGMHDKRPADQASISKLVELAKSAIDSPDLEMGDAVAGFLGCPEVNEEFFSSDRLIDFLRSNRKERITAGFRGLLARGKTREVGLWLESCAEKYDPEVSSYYRSMASYLRGNPEDWEKAVLIHLFRQDPLEGLKTVSVYAGNRIEGGLEPDCEAIVRSFVLDQLSQNRRRWWKELSERNQRGELKPEERLNCQALSRGIALIDRRDDPADAPLLKEFLDHPAASISYYQNGGGIQFFTARETAKQCLKRRKIQIPELIVTQIEFDPPIAHRVQKENSHSSITRYDLPIAGMAAFALAVVGLIVVKIRRKAGTAKSA